MKNSTLGSLVNQDTTETLSAITPTPAASIDNEEQTTNHMLVKVRNRELMRDTMRKTNNCLKLLQSTQATLGHMRRQRSEDE